MTDRPQITTSDPLVNAKALTTHRTEGVICIRVTPADRIETQVRTDGR